MTEKHNTDSPSAVLTHEVQSFFKTLDNTPPDAVTACAGWTAHELTAHLVAAAEEIVLNLEAYADNRPIPQTRSFEVREAPYRALDDKILRSKALPSIERVARVLDHVLLRDPDAVVPWTGRQMIVSTFITHLRSELAIHRWDLIGDDETSWVLLSQKELTDHAVTVLGRVLTNRGANSVDKNFKAVISTPEANDIVVLTDDQGARIEQSEFHEAPSIICDPAARLLFLWGRRSADPGRLRAPSGAFILAQLQTLLAGY